MKIFWACFAACWIAGFALIGYFVYLREFVISGDPSDPLRETSTDLLWASCGCFLLSSAIAHIVRSFTR